MGVDVVTLGEVTDSDVAQEPLRDARRLACDEVDEGVQENVAPPHHVVGDLAWQHLSDHIGQWLHLRHRDDVRGCPLEHRHRVRCLGKCRDQRDRRRPATDHHHFLAGDVEILRPELRMDHLAGEVLQTLELRCVALVVVVVAGAEEQEPAPERGLGAVVFGMHGPGVGGRIPIGRPDSGVESDVPVDAVLVCGGGDVVADVVAVGHRLLTRPGLVRKAEGEDVAVRADSGVPEQVPGAADSGTALEQCVGERRILLGDPVGRADP